MKTKSIRWENGGCLPIPLASIWITGACTLACKHCYEKGMRGYRYHQETIRVMEALDKIFPYVNSVSFMGGEPTLHPDIAKLCEYAKSHGKYTLLVTNAATASQQLVRDLKGHIDCLKIGMDGVDAKAHNAVRGKDSFEKSMEAWQLFAGEIPTMCKFTLNAENIEQLTEIAPFYQKLGAKRLILNGWLRIGNGASICNKRFSLSEEMKDSINRYVQLELKKNYHDFPISRSCSLDDGCTLDPARTYYITRSGAISPCIFSGHFAIGNIYDPQVEMHALIENVNAIRSQYENLHYSRKHGCQELFPFNKTLLAGCKH